MSLLRLLTTGKSLVGLKDTGNRYSVALRGLPKFASKKNPFRASIRPQPESMPGGQSSSGLNLAEANEINDDGCDQSLPPQQVTPPLATAAPQISPVKSFKAPERVAEDNRPKSPSRWRVLLPWLRQRKSPPAIPRFSKTMVQGELSLEAVKVVRNDLSDSDLEIVPKKVESPAALQKPAPNRQEAPSPENAWERLAERFLGAGKT